MVALGEAGFEAARAVLHAYIAVASLRLDRAGRARVLRALDQPEGGALEGAMPALVRRTFVRSQPPLDTDAVGRFLDGVLARLAMQEHGPTLLRRLGHGALLEGRRSLGWPELVMAGALLEAEGAPAADAVILDRLGPLADRYAALAHALTRLEADLRGKSERVLDDAGRPLFIGEDGAPTPVGFREEALRALDKPLYAAPPEMQRDPFVESYLRDELWTRHFRRLPDGEHKLEAWLRGNAKTERIPRRPLEVALPPDPARLGILLDDAELLFAEIDAHLACMAALAELDEGPSIFCTPASVATLTSLLADAQSPLAEARAQLASLLARGDRSTRVSQASGAFEDPLPLACLEVGAEPFGTLRERVAITGAVHAWLGHPDAALAIPRVDRRLVEAFAARLRAEVPPREDLAPFVVALFRAEGVLSRGLRAFSDLASTDAASSGLARGRAAEAAHASEQLALDLALSQLSHGLDEAFFMAARANQERPLLEVVRAFDALLGRDTTTLPKVQDPVLERARICLELVGRGVLLTPALSAALERWSLELLDVRAEGDADLWPQAFPVLLEHLRTRRDADGASLLLRLARPIPKVAVSTLEYGFARDTLTLIFGGGAELRDLQRLDAKDDDGRFAEVFFVEVEGDAVRTVHPLRVLKRP